MAVALLLAGTVIVAYEVYAYRQQKAQEIVVQAEMLAASVTAPLEFNDRKAAQEFLNTLRANRDFAAAAIYAADGSLFASYSRAGAPVPPRAQPADRPSRPTDLVTFWPAREGSRQVGTVYLRLSTEPLMLRLARYGGIILIVMIGSLLITLPVSARLHAVIAGPLREMADAARRVAAGEVVVRPPPAPRQDEIGQLEDAFKQMGVSLQQKADVARRIAAGDLAVQVVPQSEHDVLGNALVAMVHNLQQKAETAKLIATGDLTVQVTLQSERDELGRAFATMVGNLRELNRQVSDGVGVLGSSTSAILAGTTQVAAGTTQAAAVIAQTAVTLDEVKQTALVSTQKAKYVSETAQKAAQVSQTGRRSVEDAIEGMQQIREQMEMIAESIMRLSRTDAGHRRDHRERQRPVRAVQPARGQCGHRGGQGRRARRGLRGGRARGEEPRRAVAPGHRAGAHHPRRHPEGDQPRGAGGRAGHARRSTPARASPRTPARPSSAWPTASPRARRRPARSRCRRSSSSSAWTSSRRRWATSRPRPRRTSTAPARPKLAAHQLHELGQQLKSMVALPKPRHGPGPSSSRLTQDRATTGALSIDDTFLQQLLATFQVEAEEHLADDVGAAAGAGARRCRAKRSPARRDAVSRGAQPEGRGARGQPARTSTGVPGAGERARRAEEAGAGDLADFFDAAHRTRRRPGADAGRPRGRRAGRRALPRHARAFAAPHC